MGFKQLVQREQDMIKLRNNEIPDGYIILCDDNRDMVAIHQLVVNHGYKCDFSFEPYGIRILGKEG